MNDRSTTYGQGSKEQATAIQTAEQIRTLLAAQESEMLSTLQTLVEIETPSSDPTSQASIFAKLREEFAKSSLYTSHIPGKQSGGMLLAYRMHRKKHRPLQLLVGHCDTVWPLGTLQEMPFLCSADACFGPGVYDMKAGLVQMIYAIRTLAKLDLEMEIEPVILINSDEEIGSRDSTPMIRRLARICTRAYVLEPPLGLEGKLKTARKGLGRFTLTIKGKAAHAGLNPGEGVSAIVELSHQVQKLFALNDHERGITVNVGMIRGGTAVNVVAPESSAIIDVRVLTREDARNVTERIRSLTPVHPDVTLSIDGHIGRPPMEATPRNQQLWQLAKETGQMLGLELEAGTAGGGSDGNTTSLYCATLDGLGTCGDGAHAQHEQILRASFQERTLLLAMLLLAAPLNMQS